MKRPSLVIAAITGALLVSLVGLFAFASNDPNRGIGTELVGRAAPAIAGTDQSGAEVSLDDLRGQWVLVNFYNSDCVGCVVEQPELAAWDQRHNQLGDGTILGVHYLDEAFDETLTIDEFFETYGGEWPVVEDPGSQFAFDYGVIRLPESFLIDPAGILVHKFIGGTNAVEIDAEMVTWDERRKPA